jgi:hypothetical protein
MKITHIHPRAGVPWEQTNLGGPLTEIEVWEEIREATMRDEGVLFPETHQYAADDFLEELEKGRFDREQVMLLSLDPIKRSSTYRPEAPSSLSWCKPKAARSLAYMGCQSNRQPPRRLLLSDTLTLATSVTQGTLHRR